MLLRSFPGPKPRFRSKVTNSALHEKAAEETLAGLLSTTTDPQILC